MGNGGRGSGAGIGFAFAQDVRPSIYPGLGACIASALRIFSFLVD